MSSVCFLPIATDAPPEVSSDCLLLHGDAISKLLEIPNNSIDLVLVDPPYGVTGADWDKIEHEWWPRIWELLSHKCKKKSSVLVFGTDPFLSPLRLVDNSLFQYRYDLIWVKNIPTGMSNATKQPMRQHENIAYFTKPGVRMEDLYHPQMRPREKSIEGYATKASSSAGLSGHLDKKARIYKEKYPTTVINCPKTKSAPSRPWLSLHPTQKPTALLKYLIATYTNSGERVLDFCMGSGSTGVAALASDRKFTGIEMDKRFFDIATTRLGKYADEIPHMNEVYNKYFQSPV